MTTRKRAAQEAAEYNAKLPGFAMGSQQALPRNQSPLATKLLLMWSSGNISAVQVQEIAHAALLDGASHPEIASLAEAGCCGEHTSNIARDIEAVFLQDLKVPKAYPVSTKAKDPKSLAVVDVLAGVFLPHLLFFALQEYSDFDAMFGIPIITQFWQGVLKTNDPRLHQHPMTQVANWKNIFIPVFIFGDGVEFQTRDSLMAFVWGSLLTDMTTMDSTYLISAFPKSCTVKAEGPGSTWHELWKWIVWSFQAMFEGHHPARDPDGKLLPSTSEMGKLAGRPLNPKGYRVVCWALQGDHEYFANTLKLPHWSCDAPCWDCDTVTSDPLKTWKEMRPGLRGWTVKSIESAQASKPDHPFFQLKGCTEKTVSHDALHVLFCKGVLAHLLGSSLHTMIWPHTGRQSVPPQQRLGCIFQRIQELYKENKANTRITNLRFSMFTQEDKPWAEWPFLKTKGAETKHLLPCIAQISKELCTGSQHDLHRTAALEAMVEFVKLLDECEFFLNTSQADAAQTLTDTFLGHYAWLQQWAEGQNRFCYHVTIKFHMLQHLALQARYLNPSRTWNFRCEDAVGKLADIGHSVMMGVRTTHLSIKLGAKYRQFLHFRLSRT